MTVRPGSCSEHTGRQAGVAAGEDPAGSRAWVSWTLAGGRASPACPGPPAALHTWVSLSLQPGRAGPWLPQTPELSWARPGAGQPPVQASEVRLLSAALSPGQGWLSLPASLSPSAPLGARPWPEQLCCLQTRGHGSLMSFLTRAGGQQRGRGLLRPAARSRPRGRRLLFTAGQPRTPTFPSCSNTGVSPRPRLARATHQLRRGAAAGTPPAPVGGQRVCVLRAACVVHTPGARAAGAWG